VLVYLAILVVMWVFMYSFIGTVTYGALGPGVAMVDDAGGTIENANLEDVEFADPSVRQTGPE
jgi:cytochrome c oxidase subunit 2